MVCFFQEFFDESFKTAVVAVDHLLTSSGAFCDFVDGKFLEPFCADQIAGCIQDQSFGFFFVPGLCNSFLFFLFGKAFHFHTKFWLSRQ